MSSPWGGSIVIDHICLGCIIKLGEREFASDLFVLQLVYYDVILGMDWLASYHALVDCFAKTVTFSLLSEEVLVVWTYETDEGDALG